MSYPFVGPVEVPTPTAGANPTTKTYVDDGLATKAGAGHDHDATYAPVDHTHGSPGPHAATHAEGGADPVSPASIGAATSEHAHSPAVKPFPPVDLVDAATVATDASLGTHFRVTIAGNRTLGAPTNPTDGQVAVWEVSSPGTARTLSLSVTTGGFEFGSDITATTAIAANTRDLVQAMYSATADRWLVIGYVKGF